MCGVVTLLVQLALGGVRARARVPFSVNSRAGPAPYAGYHVRLPKFMHGTPARTPGADHVDAGTQLISAVRNLHFHMHIK